MISNGDVGLPGVESQEQALYYPGNNHGSLIEIDGSLYVFYHRHTHGSQFSRQGCIEPVTMKDNGDLEQACITSAGLYGKPLPARGIYPAASICVL